jgi:hypothetical protein
MMPLIGSLIAEAATQAFLVARPSTWPAPAPRPVDVPPAFDLVLIKIELNFFGR